jgi:hypothetical protein
VISNPQLNSDTSNKLLTPALKGFSHVPKLDVQHPTWVSL